MRKIRRLIKNERGSQLLEFVAMFPLIIFAFLFIWQMALAAYTVVVAEAAARDGARVAAVGADAGSVQNAVQRSAYGLNTTSSVQGPQAASYGGEEITVVVKAELLTIQVPFINELEFTVTASATMPFEGVDEP
ncbi:TadE/TadG family type IV pilus assembly protein [Bacillus horti]|uniref:Flp pilus assembly protein TadG n=1 Tax=Caldalkalibacillus horti TaxID=77523 RepID=A0ABT9VW39_9BACI|nr:TadE family protein [Bacillus horti]MDQ0165216.1 Flp pilus assembly protein TadG [Bacillus horti]